jgi:hypothetical protein
MWGSTYVRRRRTRDIRRAAERASEREALARGATAVITADAVGRSGSSGKEKIRPQN